MTDYKIPIIKKSVNIFREDKIQIIFDNFHHSNIIIGRWHAFIKREQFPGQVYLSVLDNILLSDFNVPEGNRLIYLHNPNGPTV